MKICALELRKLTYVRNQQRRQRHHLDHQLDHHPILHHQIEHNNTAVVSLLTVIPSTPSSTIDVVHKVLCKLLAEVLLRCVTYFF